MDINSTAYFEKLANDIMFTISEQEAEELKAEFTLLLKQIDVLNEIDTSTVIEMIYPFEEETTFLREDKVEHTTTQQEALSNVACVKAGHVHVPKVVK